jgi:hypothetical protein
LRLKANGIPEPNHVYSISCTSCSTRLSDCPRGRNVTVKELTHIHVGICEIKAFGLAFKETTQPRDKCGEIGAKCALVLCKKGQICVNGLCVVELGGKCSKDEDCQDSTTQQCSDISKTCRLRVGIPCLQKENLCYERLLCDPFRGKCSFWHSDNCTGHPQQCFQGLVCDFNCECKKIVGDGCNANTDCVAGAVCVSGKCQCSEHANTDPSADRRMTIHHARVRLSVVRTLHVE